MEEYREKVACVIAVGDKYVFTLRRDHNKNRDFLIPPGGGIEPGETPTEAAVREIGEELLMDIQSPELLGAVENQFVWRMKERREKIFLFLHRCTHPGEVPTNAVEASGEVLPLVAMTIQQLRESELPIFPEGLLDLMEIV